ncbi:MAG: HlyD family type I secretion periplasmic adaptor subunit, partial [Paracoccaceae bacterium]
MSSRDWDIIDFTDGRDATRLGRSSGALFIFLLIVVLMVCAGIAWAAFARIEEVARADGRVVPSGQARTVESL